MKLPLHHLLIFQIFLGAYEAHWFGTAGQKNVSKRFPHQPSFSWSKPCCHRCLSLSLSLSGALATRGKQTIWLAQLNEVIDVLTGVAVPTVYSRAHGEKNNAPWKWSILVNLSEIGHGSGQSHHPSPEVRHLVMPGLYTYKPTPATFHERYGKSIISNN